MDDQQEQKPKKGTVDRINDLANQGKSAYKWGQRARHPIQTFNAAKQNAAKLGNTVRHPISAARTAMGIGQAAQGASEAGAVSTGTGTAGTAGGTAGATAASTGGVAGSASAAGSAGVAGTGAATTAASGATGAASAVATGAQAVAASTTTALGAGVFATFIIFAAIFFMAFIILFPGFAGTGEGALIPPGGGGQLPSTNTGPLSCPVSGGRSQVTCGGKFSPVNGCGHCGIGYEQYMSGCTPGYEGINYALDIAAPAGAPIYLPTIENDTIQWTFLSQRITGGGAIQRYAGRNTKTQEQYFIQFHHTESGSGKPGTRLSGELAGQICLSCKYNNHVHVELENGNSSYLEASRYLCTQ
jgi:hypothetical protein